MQIRLKFRSSVRDRIAEKGFDVKYGARPLRRAVQNEIEDELAEEILSGKIKAGQSVVCTLRGGKIVFEPGKDEETAE
jgi:ATP-dependent Clp protease ATP-binding subunit ClpC